MLRESNQVAVQGPPWSIRLTDEAASEIEPWNTLYRSLSGRQIEALHMELKTAVFYTIEGIREMWRLDARYDFFPAGFQILSVGLEHLLKLTLTLTLLHTDGHMPPARFLRGFGHDLVLVHEALREAIGRSEAGTTFMGRAYADGLALDPVAEAMLASLSDFIERLGRYHYLETFVADSGVPPDPVVGFTSLQDLLVELSRDPEDAESIPELFTIAESGTQAEFHEEMTVRLLHPVVSFAQEVAEFCQYFSPLLDPAELSFLLYLRWETEPPRAWYEDWPPRRPRAWIDAALGNERWEKARNDLLQQLRET